MKEFYSVQEIRDLDNKAIKNLGIPGEQLMENAGQAVTAYILDNYPQGNYKKVLVVCGKGNNGGDGLVIARILLSLGYDVEVILLGKEKDLQGDAKTNLERWLTMKNVHSLDKKSEQTLMRFSDISIIIDAIFGTGFKGQVKEPAKTIIKEINKLHAEKNIPVVAVDIPSGINGDQTPAQQDFVKANATITFVAKKLAMKDESYFGKLIVTDIGIPL